MHLWSAQIGLLTILHQKRLRQIDHDFEISVLWHSLPHFIRGFPGLGSFWFFLSLTYGCFFSLSRFFSGGGENDKKMAVISPSFRERVLQICYIRKSVSPWLLVTLKQSRCQDLHFFLPHLSLCLPFYQQASWTVTSPPRS